MANDVDIECHVDQRHVWYYTYVGGPMLCIYVVGIPLLSFTLLYWNRHVLDDPSVRVKFMMLSAGYKTETFYWECVVMLRKTIMVCVAVYFRHINVEEQAYLAILVLSSSLGLQVLFTPYKAIHTAWMPSKGYYSGKEQQLLNNLEATSLITNFFTLYLGILFHNDISSSRMKYILVTLLILINALFMVWSICIYIHQLHREGRVLFLDNLFKNVNKLKHRRECQQRQRHERARTIFYEKRRTTIKGISKGVNGILSRGNTKVFPSDSSSKMIKDTGLRRTHTGIQARKEEHKEQERKIQDEAMDRRESIKMRAAARRQSRSNGVGMAPREESSTNPESKSTSKDSTIVTSSTDKHLLL